MKIALISRGITSSRPVTITALLHAAMEHFAEQGYGATSIPDVCTRAGLTKGACTADGRWVMAWGVYPPLAAK